MTRFRLGMLALTCTGFAIQAGAHHSFSEYDQGHPIELVGKLIDVRWENPHVHFTLQRTDASGQTGSWDLESNSLSILRRTNATPENLKAGQTVKVAGWPSKRAGNRLFVTNVLQATVKSWYLICGRSPAGRAWRPVSRQLGLAARHLQAETSACFTFGLPISLIRHRCFPGRIPPSIP